jgi:hypothetical protein
LYKSNQSVLKHRGVGLLAERNTNTELEFCKFDNNKSNDLAGSLFNRGKMDVSDSSFHGNLGRVSEAILSFMHYKNDRFSFI